MNAALKLCQANFDAQLPQPVSDVTEDAARTEWLFNAAEELSRGGEVKFQRRMHAVQGVSGKEFALAVDEHVNGRLAGCDIETASLGHLVIAAKRGQADKVAADELLGHSEHPLGMLGEIAEALLKPLVEDALIALAEDNEL
ncbi:hypothetical protein [Pseudomonas fitomaticsae]|uniref:Uncharacterized protein n=1 Tax=Pseudomonas fitomaticsae TaxID=2837969 RepID=A0ABY3Q7X9_9PSED|nr:hypothetical protein [Pseudomonas fitomaticsae]UFQ02226.1 hypothetical protein KJY40_11235 [Pseudomonas fitomaticsae]